MGQVSRRPARIFAMQTLYVMEINACTPGDAIPAVLDSEDFAPDMQEYGMKLVDLVLAHRQEFDKTLREMSTQWDLERIALLDRILIHIGFAELSHCGDVPVKVALQEAVQIANKYSTEQSGRFINGILDRFARNRNLLGESV
ncbi:MAG TPA: transcription antitermination factor NusB [Fibrobacteraceae bacterium]|nr:transcription antitermination factor NusB [Fibrobacteraceae bacterium]